MANSGWSKKSASGVRSKTNKAGNLVTRKKLADGSIQKQVQRTKNGRKIARVTTKNKTDGKKTTRIMKTGGKNAAGKDRKSVVRTTVRNKKGKLTSSTTKKTNAGGGGTKTKTLNKDQLSVKNRVKASKAGYKGYRGQGANLSWDQKSRANVIGKIADKSAKRKKISARIAKRTAAGKDTSTLKAKRKSVGASIRQKTNRAANLTGRIRKQRAKKNK